MRGGACPRPDRARRIAQTLLSPTAMRSRWFHRARLHVAGGPHKRVGWLELFYDLVFVAAIIQLGDGLSSAGLASFALHFVPLWVAWTGFTFYANRFTIDDLTHRMLVLGKMFAVGAMAIASRTSMEGDSSSFSLAFAAVQGIVAVLNWRAWKHLPEARDYAKYWGGVFATSGLVFLVAAAVPTPWAWLLWAVGLLVILAAPLSRGARDLADRYPTDQEHLSERYGLLTLIVLGESFVKVLSWLTQADTGLEAQLRGFFNLGITCSVWWIYFDDIAGSALRKERGSWFVWLFSHLPLTLGVTALGVAVKKAIELEAGAPAPDGVRWLLAGSLAGVFTAIAALDSATERPDVQVSDGVRITSRLVSAALLLILAKAGAGMTGDAFLGVVAALCVAQVAVDLVIAPASTADTLDHAVPTAQLAAERRDGAARSPARAAIGVAVRVGAPTEFRRDLYFFFLEGGWTRLFVTFVAAYLGLNLLFAGLFMMEPAGVGGVESLRFVDAFFLSVQTLGTIGYGVLHPRSEWANLVVTAEAAVGMLFAALATGTVLAKAARPHSAVLFARHAVITTRNGQRMLQMRMANARGNEVVEASVSVAAVVEEISAEGQHLRRVVDLELARNRQPMFALSWTLMHVLDEKSPLSKVNLHDPNSWIGIVVTLLGHDGTYNQTTHARHIYTPDSIRFDHHYVDVMSQLPDGRLVIDLGRFHDTEPD